MSQPTKRSNEMAEAICQGIAGGKGLRKLCGELGVTKQFVRVWLNEDSDFASQYAQAREEQADHYAEEILEISDAVRGCLKNEEVQAAKLMVDSRKWVAAHLRPKKWGDRLIHAGDPEQPVSVRNLSDEQLASRAVELLRKAGAGGNNPGSGSEGGA